MATEPQRLTDLERSNLVAYLDNELDPSEADYLRTKITLSVTARREIEALEKTWELLDYLDRPKASEELTSRTLAEVVKIDSRGGELDDAAGRVGWVASRVLACVATAIVTLGIGYVVTRWVWPDQNARLARDLPIAEHLDEYREAGSFEFLKMLDTSPSFNEDLP